MTFDGEIGKPQTVDIDELMKRAPLDFYAFLHFATYLGLGFVK